MEAKGTQDNPIVFTSIKDDIHGGDTNNDKAASSPGIGDWGYIYFGDTSHDSILEHCKILYGGRVNNSSYAVVYLNTASPTIRNCTFEYNRSYVIDMDLPSHPIVEGNSVSKNGYNGMHVRSGNYTQSGHWDSTNMPYILMNDINIESSSTLTIGPGVIIKLYGYYYSNGKKWDGYYIHIKGKLEAKGTQDNPIVFTSILDDIHGGDTNNDKAASAPGSGNWGYIYFSDISYDSVLEHCKILYGGRINNSNIAVVYLNSASPTIANCEFTYNRYGISCAAQASPQILGNIIRKCTSDAIWCSDRSTPVIHQNSIYDNGGLGVNNTDQNVVIDAQNNWWGDATGPLDKSDDTGSGGWYNLNGLGNAVSDYVDYGSWLDAPIPSPVEITQPDGGQQIARHTFTLTLFQGLNMISPPLKPDESYSARTFCEKLGATMMVRLNAPSQKFESFVPGVVEGPGFPIEGGGGYIVNVIDSKQVVFEGEGWHDVLAGPPASFSNNSSGAWAFVIGGWVMDENGQRITGPENVFIEVKNVELGVTLTGGLGQVGQAAYLVTYYDATQQTQFSAGQTLEIRARGADGRVIGKPVYHKLTSQEIARAYAIVSITKDMLVDSFSLGPNYPNPFNAETWIPYVLSKPSRVTIEIYDTKGMLIRAIRLGYRNPGAYVDKQHAAYWNGKNDSGEYAASGIYFCRLTTGATSVIRKLVIQK